MPLPKHAYFRGKIVPYEEAKVGVLTHGLNYGTAAFGGLRGYWNANHEQLYLFRPHDHYKRFLHSTRLLRMKFDETAQSLTEKTVELLRVDGYRREVYVRPLAYIADEIIGVKLHGLTYEISIVVLPFEKYVPNDTNAHVTVSSWRRVDDNMIPARGKISGAYVNSSLIKTDAVQAGFDEALVLNQDGHISEGSAMNIFMVRDNTVVTPPVSANILEGITRRSIIQVIQDELQMQVVERQIDRTEVYICDELFMTGTAAQVVSITRVDYSPVNTGVMGPVASRLRELFDQIVRGDVEKYHEWNYPVYT